MNIIRKNTETGFLPTWFDASLDNPDVHIVNAPEPMRVGFAYYDKLEDLFYILGYYNGAAYQDKLYSFNPKNGEWKLLSEATTSGRGGLQDHLWKREDWLYWGLGFLSKGVIHRYNLKTNVLEENYLTGVHQGIADHFNGSTCVYDEESQTIYSMGGKAGSTHYSHLVKVVDLGGQNEEIVKVLADYSGNEHPFNGAGVYHDGYCYVKAGGTGSNNADKNPIFKRYNVEEDSWENLSNMPVSTAGEFMWFYNGDIYYKHRDSLDVHYLHRYSIKEDTWSEVQKTELAPQQRGCVYSVRNNGKELWCFGGLDNANNTLDTVRLVSLDKTKGIISSLKNPPSRKKPYRGTFYRTFRVSMTNSTDLEGVSAIIVRLSAHVDGGIIVKPGALVDIRQVRFKMLMKLNDTNPDAQTIAAFWKVDGEDKERREYEWLNGCNNGLDIDEQFRPGYTSQIVDMGEHNAISFGYDYNFSLIASGCEEAVSKRITAIISIPEDSVVDTINGQFSITEIS